MRAGSAAGTPRGPGASLIEVRLRGSFGEDWIPQLASRWHAAVQLHVCRPGGPRGARLLRLLEVGAEPSTIGEIEAFLRKVNAPDIVSYGRIAADRLLVWTTRPMPKLCRAVFAADGVCTTCPYLPATADGVAQTWGVLVASSAAGRSVKAAGRAGHPSATVVRVGRYLGPNDLTPRQERALEVAYHLGYFAYPRRADLSDVARALAVSRSTAMEVLRRAMMKLAAQRHERVGAANGFA